MDRIRSYFQSAPPDQEYAALDTEDSTTAHIIDPIVRAKKVSRFDYAVFVVLGVSMLWSWNCFLAAAAYFQMRFQSDPYIRKNFLPSILVVSTCTTLLTTIILSNIQTTARYTYRITVSLVINIVVFTILALSTVLFTGVSPKLYLAFILAEVLCTAGAGGLAQNGLFAFVSSFDPIYAQAVMTGQGVAGILPAIAQIVTVLAIPARHDDGMTKAEGSPKSAFAYFLTATGVSGIALLSFGTLLAKHRSNPNVATSDPIAAEEVVEGTLRKKVSLWTLLLKLKYLVFAVFTTFAVTMTFPVFTQAILSNNPTTAGRIFQPEVFIPLGFLFWNVGDFVGRVICAFPRCRLHNPRFLALFALSRLVFIPLYFLCNVSGKGAVVKSDAFYFVVQLGFGFTNGWLGSNTMMAAPGFVGEEERGAAGGFMGLWLVGGLAAGSGLSFLLTI